ncbi:hypothetical protein [Psittacicella hinzii]|uniref:Uncharacterized protein n=1 Tax=Psittacicella hinzii TaxID=2028575 RepID=A0A3A1YAK9_9GAMM|nr:hypothetical protein [Psittacicella hinzii]RIY34705.1 hypothetical protein CKF58_07790 [Psittacicella hinzii]
MNNQAEDKDLKAVKFFIGLDTFAIIMKHWRVSIVMFLFITIVYQIQVSAPYISSENIRYYYLEMIAISLILALGVTISIFSILYTQRELTQNNYQDKPALNPIFNRSLWQATKQMLFLGTSLLVYWSGFIIYYLSDQLFYFNIISNNTVFTYLRTVVLCIYAFFLFPYASLRINRLVNGKENRSYKNFSIFLLVNSLSIILSYLLGLVIVIAFIATMAFIFDKELIVYTINQAFVPIIFLLYLVALQALFQFKFNQKIAL